METQRVASGVNLGGGVGNAGRGDGRRRTSDSARADFEFLRLSRQIERQAAGSVRRSSRRGFRSDSDARRAFGRLGGQDRDAFDCEITRVRRVFQNRDASHCANARQRSGEGEARVGRNARARARTRTRDRAGTDAARRRVGRNARAGTDAVRRRVGDVLPVGRVAERSESVGGGGAALPRRSRASLRHVRFEGRPRARFETARTGGEARLAQRAGGGRCGVSAGAGEHWRGELRRYYPSRAYAGVSREPVRAKSA